MLVRAGEISLLVLAPSRTVRQEHIIEVQRK